MSVINTIEWLSTSPNQYEICDKLTPYFSKMNAREISDYLHSFGMYKRYSDIQDWIDVIKDKRILTFINDEKKKLKNEWKGPSVPTFLFPVDVHNRKIEMEYRGRSGLAFHDKLFLFISTDVKKEDIKSLLIHEYHHVCRLAAITKPEKDFTIIDTIIMEGLAENAVREKLGEEAVSEWTKLYHSDQCDRFLERMILPQKKMTRQDPKFIQLMFGTGFYPKMLGYAVGYHLVKKYMEKTKKMTKELLGVTADDFI